MIFAPLTNTHEKIFSINGFSEKTIKIPKNDTLTIIYFFNNDQSSITFDVENKNNKNSFSKLIIEVVNSPDDSLIYELE